VSSCHRRVVVSCVVASKCALPSRATSVHGVVFTASFPCSMCCRGRLCRRCSALRGRSFHSPKMSGGGGGVVHTCLVCAGLGAPGCCCIALPFVCKCEGSALRLLAGSRFRASVSRRGGCVPAWWVCPCVTVLVRVVMNPLPLSLSCSVPRLEEGREGPRPQDRWPRASAHEAPEHHDAQVAVRRGYALVGPLPDAHPQAHHRPAVVVGRREADHGRDDRAGC
jgi:hypothetical protein